MARGWRPAIAVAGFTLQLVGLALDAVLHARDATLAAREGPFTLTNPGHLVFAAGLALTILGVTAGLFTTVFTGLRGSAMPRGTDGGPRPGVRLLAALSAVVLLVLAAGTVVLGAGGSGEARHEADSIEHPHAGTVNVSWEQLREIERMLAEAKAATAKYQDVDVARSDGYRQSTPVYPQAGAHFVNLQFLAAGTFDLAHPAFLLYDRAPDGSLELVGIDWSLPRYHDYERPPRFFAPLAAWHSHREEDDNRCYRPVGREAVAEPSTPEACQAVGGVFTPKAPWGLHAWLFRPGPEGIFSPTNSTIKGTGPFDGIPVPMRPR